MNIGVRQAPGFRTAWVGKVNLGHTPMAWRSLGNLLISLLLTLDSIGYAPSPITVLPIVQSSASKTFLPYSGVEVSLGAARVIVPKGALTSSSTLSIKVLPDTVLPPLEASMVNVTAGGGGYEFLPSGTSLLEPVLIEIPLSNEIAKGDIEHLGNLYSFSWNEAEGKWEQLEKVRVDAEHKTIVSKIIHFSKTINAILVAPNNPPPLQFNPNSIKDMAALDPTSGLTLIQPPSANNQGTAELSYPIQLPKGRGAFSPQLSLSYSSDRGNGWLGMGWDMPVPKIEIDTRWGVPAYGQIKIDIQSRVATYDGTERFLLQGAALVPIQKEVGASCLAQTEATLIGQYTTRNDTFQRILLCATKDSLSGEPEMHWEVTDSNGTRFEYGIDDESRLTSYQQDESNHTGIWYLRRVIDTNNNVTEFHYQTDKNSSGSNAEPYVQKYLQEIDYTSHLSQPSLLATYQVVLTSDCNGRTDPIISGRLGFKVVTRCRLDEVAVSFQDPNTHIKSLVRKYKLEYNPGAFGKSTLTKLAVIGSDGHSQFYEHTFEYTEPEYKAGPTFNNQPFANTETWTVTDTDPKLLAPDKYLLNYNSFYSHNGSVSLGLRAGFDVNGVGISCQASGHVGGTLEFPQPEARGGDISGDGVADRSWISSDGVQTLLGFPGQNKFYSHSNNTSSVLPGLGSIGSEQSWGFPLGLGASCSLGPASANAGLSLESRTSVTKSMLTDANGDGYLDLAYGSSFIPHEPSQCRDGGVPDSNGLCSDGLPVCSTDDPLCFGGGQTMPGIKLADNQSSSLAERTSPSDSDNEPVGMFVLAKYTKGEEHNPILPSVQPESQHAENLTAEADWGFNTALRNRLEQDPKLKDELYRLDPVIRWDAQYYGTIQLIVKAQRKYLGGSDGVTVSVLRVKDATISSGTTLLGKLSLPPTLDGEQTVTLPNGGFITDVQFGESFLVVLDTVDNVPITQGGKLIDEIKLNIHIEYKSVCPAQQLDFCHVVTSTDLNHRDATGQLAYVYDYPSDFRLSELPRLGYWHLLPPIGPPRPRPGPQGGFDYNQITGIVKKLAPTDTPVHVRVRCESIASRQADDGTICPIGTVLKEHVFGANETDSEADMTVELPNPFRPVYRIAGTHENAAGQERAFIWTPDAKNGNPQLVDIGTLGSDYSVAEDINDDNAIVGESGVPGNINHAFLWTAENGMVDLTNDLEKGGRSWAFGINNLMQVAGTSLTAAGKYQAWLASPQNSLSIATQFKLEDLRSLGGGESQARDINEYGQIVGWSKVTGGKEHAFLWSASSNPQMLDLGVYTGTESFASSINNEGLVVGWGTMFTGETRAFVWLPNATETDELLSNPKIHILDTRGTSEVHATDINDKGQAVGWGKMHNGETHIFLWTLPDTDNVLNFQSKVQVDDLGSGTLKVITDVSINQHSQIVAAGQDAAGKGKIILLREDGTWEDLHISSSAQRIPAKIAISGPMEYEPLRVMMEIDGESGMEVPPEAVTWQPKLEIVSIHNLKEVSRPDPDALKIVGSGTDSAPSCAFQWSSHFGLSNLGAMGVAKETCAGAINARGQIVGRSLIGSQIHAFIWTPASTTANPSTGALQDLVMLEPTDSMSSAEDINDVGQVAGTSFDNAGNSHAFLWTYGSTQGVPSNPQMQPLGTLGGLSSIAHGINNKGQVVGESTTITGQTHAFLWTPGTIGNVTSYLFSSESDLVGELNIRRVPDSMRKQFQEHGITLSPTAVAGVIQADSKWTIVDANRTYLILSEKQALNVYENLNPPMFELPTLGGLMSRALAINDRGQVVGQISTMAGELHAFLWTPDGANGVMKDLGTLGGNESHAVAINNRGEIVGSSQTASGARGFLWTEGQMLELPSLGYASSASDINNQGEIVGEIEYQGDARAARWSTDRVPTLLDKEFLGERSYAVAVSSTSVPDFIEQSDSRALHPDAPWNQILPVLYRVHPARQLTPLRTLQDNQTLVVTVTATKLRHPLIVAVTGESVEGEMLGESVEGKTRQLILKSEDTFGKSAVTRRFTVDLPEAGLYYVRGYSEASFDTETTIQIKAELKTFRDTPQIALVNWQVAQQVGGIRTYEALNQPFDNVANAKILVVKDSLAYFAAQQTFPNARIETVASIDDALTGHLLANEALALVADSATLLQKFYLDSNVSAKTYLCCAADQLEPLIPKLPINLLMADFGGRYEVGKPFTLNMPGEVWYSFETYSGGHHGFFYGQFNGEEKLTCIGLFPCHDNGPPISWNPPENGPSVVTSTASVPTEGISKPMLPLGQFTAFESPSSKSNLSVVVNPIPVVGYLVLVRKQPSQPSIETYSDLNNSNIRIRLGVTGYDNDAISIAQDKFPNAEIEELNPFDPSLALAITKLAAGDLDAVLAPASVLQQALANGLSTNYELCCTRNKPILLFSSQGGFQCSIDPPLIEGDCLDLACYIDSNGDGVLDCHDPACQRDSDGNGIPDCKEPPPSSNANLDPDGDNVPNYLDSCPFSPEDKDGDQDEDGCPDGPQYHPAAPLATPDDKDGLNSSPSSDEGEHARRGSSLPPNNSSNGSPSQNCFGGLDSLVHICGDGSAHATRNSAVPADAGAEGMDLERSWTLGTSAYLGAGVGIPRTPITLGVTANFGRSNIWSDLAYMDWNGDGIPDLLSPESIQLGGRAEAFKLHKSCTDDLHHSNVLIDKFCEIPGIRQQLNLTGGLSFSAGLSDKVETKTDAKGKVRSQESSGNFGMNAQLSESAIFLDRIDINGDGLPDVVMAMPPLPGIESGLYVRLNLGYRLGNPEYWGKMTLPISSKTDPLSSTLRSIFASTAMENDSLGITENFSTGLTTGAGASAHFLIWGGGGKYTYSQGATLVQSQHVLADVNGDGLPDLVLKNSGSDELYIRFNNGGTVDNSSQAFDSKSLFAVSGWDKLPKLPDPNVFLPEQALSDWLLKAWRSNPDELNLSVSQNESYSGEAEETYFAVSSTQSYAYSKGTNTAEMGLYDVTGDGLADRVLRNGDEQDDGIQVQENLFGGANLLKVVHRPLGGSIVLEYTKDTPSENDPHARWTLSSTILKNEDSFPADFKTAPISINFKYSDPYYDRLEREFYGFGKVQSIRPDGRVIDTTYSNRDYRLRGQALCQKVLDANAKLDDRLRDQVLCQKALDPDAKLYEVTENTFQPARTHTAMAQCLAQLPYSLAQLVTNETRTAGTTPCDVWFAKPTAIITRHFEGGATAKETTVHFEAYDNYGNVTQIRDDQDDGTADDLVVIVKYEHETRTDFQTAHIVNHVSSVDVLQTSTSGKQLRFRRATYDERGNMKSYEVWADATGTKIDKMLLEPDEIGFLKAVTDGSGYHVDYTPEPLTYLFAIKTMDSFGLASSMKYDLGLQLPYEQVDVNGQKIIDHYDIYGRLDSEQGPYELAAGVNSLSVTYDLSSCTIGQCTAPDSATTTNLAVIPGSTAQSTKIRTAIFVDGFGRPIQTQMDADVKGIIGRTISGKVTFDDSGHMTQMGQPSFTSDSAISIINTTIPSDPDYFTSWTYDLLDRPLSIRTPGNRITQFEYAVANRPRQPTVSSMQTKITDPENKIRYEHRDAMGQLVAVVQMAGGKNLITTYDYLPTGELASILDAKGSQSELEYDLAGRRTAITTPDSGRTELGYDAAGNLVEKSDEVLCPLVALNHLAECSDQQKIRYIYDKDRLTSIIYPNLPSTRFFYGDNSTVSHCPNPMNVRGRVCRVEDASGVELRNYGGLGEIVKSDRIMQGAAWDQIDHTFTTKYVFDSFGRMLSMVYPDGETLTYGYDKGGRVNKVTGTKSNQTTTYVKDILYDEFGQRTELDYGNDVKTTQSYEPDTRRLDIQIIKSPTNTLRTLDYGYDLADNILTITDKRTNVTPFFQQADRTYTYDDLHRLKTFTLTAVPASTAPSTTVNANYDYDNVGGLLIQNVNRKEGNSVLTAYPSRDWTYTYGDPELPNLPNTIGPYTFSYDKRGAVLSFTRQSNSKAPIGATYTWDDEGRLKTSEPQGNGAVTAYTYNQDGQRARKQTPATLKNKNDPVDATVYPNEFYTARFARTSNKNCASPPCWEKVISRSKNIYVDKERIAVMASVIDPASAYNSETNLNRLTEITRYFNSDQVGSTALTTDEQGKPVQQIDYLPFGEVLFDQQASGNESLPEAYLFDGKELDSETGLQYFGARYYDPRFGRFISADPLLSWSPERGLVNPPLLNLYAYASNNPVKNREPDGQKPCTECTFEEEEVTVITNQPGKYRLNPNGPYTAPRNQSLNLSIKSDVNRSVLNESVLDRIQNAMDRAEIEAATITSSKRTPREQAEAMLNNLLTLGAKHESGLYRRQPIALEAISTAEQLKAQGWDPDMLKTAMKLTIEKDPNQFEHLRNMNNLVTIDIGPNSLLSNQLNEQCQCTMAPWSLAQRLARSLAQEPGVVSQYVLSPPVDRSIHFTITK